VKSGHHVCAVGVGGEAIEWPAARCQVSAEEASYTVQGSSLTYRSVVTSSVAWESPVNVSRRFGGPCRIRLQQIGVLPPDVFSLILGH
jgi:hypothetical protein